MAADASGESSLMYACTSGVQGEATRRRADERVRRRRSSSELGARQRGGSGSGDSTGKEASTVRERAKRRLETARHGDELEIEKLKDDSITSNEKLANMRKSGGRGGAKGSELLGARGRGRVRAKG
eukprot:311776-Pleurochrysis_carterae.AAC.2